jgi:hypothetical protein
MLGSGKWLQMSGAGFAKGRICDSRRKGAEVWRCGRVFAIRGMIMQ